MEQLTVNTTRKRSPNGKRKKDCSTCGKPIEKERWRSSIYCRNCHNTYVREHRTKYKDFTPEEKRKHAIRAQAWRALQSGFITREACMMCGNSKAEMRHPDYKKPLEVQWVCRSCHSKQLRYDNMSLSKKTWRAEYKRLYLNDLKNKHPLAFNTPESIDNYIVKIPSEGKANGLTTIIMKFLKLKGHYANRINTQGQARRGSKVVRFEAFTNKPVYVDAIKWTKGQTTRGTPDIDAIVYGKAVQIEVKVGKDTMSEHQLEQKDAIEEAGGLYFVARDMQSFYDWYNLKFAA